MSPEFSAMWPSWIQLLAIVLMAGTTYFTRIAGYLLLRKSRMSTHLQAMLDAAPCCVMISIVAPFFMTTDIITLASLALTVLYARRFNFSITVILSVLTQAALLHVNLLF